MGWDGVSWGGVGYHFRYAGGVRCTYTARRWICFKKGKRGEERAIDYVPRRINRRGRLPVQGNTDQIGLDYFRGDKLIRCGEAR